MGGTQMSKNTKDNKRYGILFKENIDPQTLETIDTGLNVLRELGNRLRMSNKPSERVLLKRDIELVKTELINIMRPLDLDIVKIQSNKEVK